MVIERGVGALISVCVSYLGRPFHNGWLDCSRRFGWRGEFYAMHLLYLVEKGLLDIPVLFLSRYIIANRAAYYEGLRRVTESQDWENWILFMLRAIEST
jgi:hypothetical protein